MLAQEPARGLTSARDVAWYGVRVHRAVPPSRASALVNMDEAEIVSGDVDRPVIATEYRESITGVSDWPLNLVSHEARVL